MKYRTYIQGSKVKEILTDIKAESPTDDDIDNEKPFTYDLAITKDKHIVYSISMLSEIDFIDFLKNFNFIKGTFEAILSKTEEESKQITKQALSKFNTADIDIRDSEATEKLEEAKKEVQTKIEDKAWSFLNDKKDFKNSFSELLVKYSTCVNPEDLINPSLVKLLDVAYIEELTFDNYYTLFNELLNINHSIVKRYSKYLDEFISDKIRKIKTKEILNQKKRLQKKYSKGKIQYETYIKHVEHLEKHYLGIYDKKSLFTLYFYKDFLTFGIHFIHKLINDIITYESVRLISEIPIQRLLPLFYKILDYNEYKAKKKFHLIQQRITNLTDQQQRSTFTYGQNLVTAKTGERAFPELSFSEL